MTSHSSSGDRDPVERLAEEFLDRHRKGERPDVAEYVERYPQWAERIQKVFPALLVMERLKPRNDEETGSAVCEPPDRDHAPRLERLGDYRILREIGRGGMGVVYEAVQESLGRHVALKVLPIHGRMSPVQMERFRLEARSAARLHHTHIVPIYGVGQHESVPYYAMQYINGHGLDAVLRDLRRLRAGQIEDEEANAKDEEGSVAVARSLLTGRFGATEPARPDDGSSPEGDRTAVETSIPPLAARPTTTASDGSVLSHHTDAGYYRTVARIGLQVAEALAHAHQQGVLHRDIKPSNLLLDVGGHVWVTDFGLAKLEGSEGPTETGDVVGTLRYMAPERFEGWSDRRSDVYGLGVTLYELLTLHPAFEEVARAKLIDQVIHGLPLFPRRHDARIPRDLETIVLKAIDKQPGERYPSVEALAADLRNFLADRPIVARRSRPPERAWRWCRRNPVAAALLVVSGLAMLTLVGLGVALGYQSRLKEAVVFGQMVLAEREWHAGNVTRAEEILDDIPADYRGWEWNYLKRVSHSEFKEISGFTTPVFCVAFSPDREHPKIASASQDGGVSVWDADSRQLLSRPDGLDGMVISVAFSPDGKSLAAGRFDLEKPGAIWIGSVDTGLKEHMIPAHFGVIWCVSYNHDGTYLASAGDDRTVLIWNTKTGQLVKSFRDETQGFTSVAFSPDGRYLAAATGNRNEHALEYRPGVVRIWDTSTWQELPTLRKHTGSVNSVTFSPDGRRLASASSDRTVRIWDWRTGEDVSTLHGHTQFTVGVAFSPDGKRLVSASEDSTLRVWDTETEENLLILHGHKGMVNSVAYSPDGKHVASGSDDKTLRIWDADQSPLARILGGADRKWFTSIAFSRDGGRLAAGNGDRTVTIWDRESYRVLTVLPEQNLPIWSVAFGPSGLLASACGDWHRAEQPSEATVWDLETSPLMPTTLPSRVKTVWCVAISPNGRLIATAGGDPWEGPAELKVWDAKTWKVRYELAGYTKGVTSVAFSPQGESLASVSNDGLVKVWDVSTGGCKLTREVGQETVLSVAFSPDGKTLATAGFRSVLILSVATGEKLRELRGHMTQVRQVVFHRNGQRLASAGDDGTVRLWDVDTGHEVLTLRGHRYAVLGVAFSPDGLQLASASRDGTVRIWDGAPSTKGTAP